VTTGLALPLAAIVLVLGCAVGVGQGVAGHEGVAVAGCLAALVGLWLLAAREEDLG
jgi:hypothetical protein